MKKQIRKNVFETNSSSSHSLTLSKGDLVIQPFSKTQLRAGVVEISVSEYHWEWRRYYSAENKLRYLLTQVTSGKLPKGDPLAITRELCEENERVKMLCDVVREHTGCELRILPGSGEIDHQSAMEEKANGLELFNSAETLRSFIFNSESCIQTGNDNDAPPWSIKTDRGDELFYAGSIREVPENYELVKLTSLHEFHDEGFSLVSGGVVGPTSPQGLYVKLLKKGIVTFVHWDSRGSYNPLGSRHVQGHSAAKVTTLRGKSGFKVSPNFMADSSFKREIAGNSSSCMTLDVRVPKDLALALADLDPNGLQEYQMATAVATHATAVSRLIEDPTHSYWTRQLATAKAQVLKLGGKKALAALTPPVVKKVAAVKGADVPAKKVPAKRVAVKKPIAP